MPGPVTIITIPSDKKNALICTANYTSKQLQQLPPLGHLLLPLGSREGRRRRRPVRPRTPTPTSAPLRSVVLPSRTCQRAPPVETRSPGPYRQEPRRFLSMRTTREEL